MGETWSRARLQQFGGRHLRYVPDAAVHDLLSWRSLSFFVASDRVLDRTDVGSVIIMTFCFSRPIPFGKFCTKFEGFGNPGN